MKTYKFEFQPTDYDEMLFRAYADRNGECDCIEVQDEDGHWYDIEEYFKPDAHAVLEVWTEYFLLVRGEGY